MTDFSKLFTDPSAEVYGPDETENAMWQQSSTNPFAVLHAIAARRNANNRRDQYGEQLAAHDARAQAGASALSAQEFRQNIPLEYIKRDQLDPSFGMDLAGLRMENGEVDPRIRRQSHAFQAGQSAGAMKTHAEGLKAYGEAGYQLEDPSRIPQNYLNLSELVEAPTLAEREQNARGNANSKLPFKKTIVEPRVDANGNMISYQENYATREEMLGQPAPTQPPPVVTGGGYTHAGKGNKNPKPVPGMQPPESTKRNAPAYAAEPAKLPAGPLKPMDALKLPQPQRDSITKTLKTGLPTARGTYTYVPNSTQSDGEGNVVMQFAMNVGNKQNVLTVYILPDGKPIVETGQ